MASIDQQFVEFIVKSLVNDPDSVTLERRIDEKGVLLELTVAPDDLGRVIGKRGATAQSIRTLLRALGTKNDARYNLKIVDNGDGGSSRPAPPPRDDQAASDDEAKADDAPAKTTDEEATESEPETEKEPEKSNEENESLADKTRKELEDLDDLDI